MSIRRCRTAAFIAVALALSAGCSPTLDWRMTRPEGSGVEMLFPCRPDHHLRMVRLLGADVSMRMDSCETGGTTFSLAFVDAPNGAALAPILQTLRDAAVTNIGGTPVSMVLEVPGATPNPLSARLRVGGRLADSRPVVEQAAFFVKGLRVYQATAIGGALSSDAADFFFTSIKVAS